MFCCLLWRLQLHKSRVSFPWLQHLSFFLYSLTIFLQVHFTLLTFVISVHYAPDTFSMCPFFPAFLPISCFLLSFPHPTSSQIISTHHLLSPFPSVLYSNSPVSKKFTAKYFILFAPWQDFSGQHISSSIARFSFLLSFFVFYPISKLMQCHFFCYDLPLNELDFPRPTVSFVPTTEADCFLQPWSFSEISG